MQLDRVGIIVLCIVVFVLCGVFAVIAVRVEKQVESLRQDSNWVATACTRHHAELDGKIAELRRIVEELRAAKASPRPASLTANPVPLRVIGGIAR